MKSVKSAPMMWSGFLSASRKRTLLPGQYLSIHQIMQRAVGRVIASNPVDLVQLTEPGHKAEQRRALTDEEQRWIWDTPHRGQPVAVIMILSGLRRGELAALTWNDVDLKGRTITVNKTMEYPPNQPPSSVH